MTLDLKPYRDYIQQLNDYRRNFEDLAVDARSAMDFHTSKECLVEAIKLRSAVMQLEGVIEAHLLTEGKIGLPEIPKVFS